MPGLALGRLLGTEQSVAPQDLRDPAGRRHLGLAPVEKKLTELAAAPGGILIPQGQDRLLQGLGSLIRTAVGTTAQLLKAGLALLMVPGEPLVARLGADPVGAAQGLKRSVM